MVKVLLFAYERVIDFFIDDDLDEDADPILRVGSIEVDIDVDTLERWKYTIGLYDNLINEMEGHIKKSLPGEGT